MSALTGKADISFRSAIGQKLTLAQRLKTPKIKHWLFQLDRKAIVWYHWQLAILNTQCPNSKFILIN